MFHILLIFRLTQKHDGVYLATVVANCLKQFGLEKLVCFLFVCIFILAKVH